MRINVSTVRRIAYSTRTDMLRVDTAPLNPQPLTSTLPEISGKCGTGWKAYSPIPSYIQVHQVCIMPLQSGGPKGMQTTGDRGRNNPPKRWKVTPNYNPGRRDHEVVNA